MPDTQLQPGKTREPVSMTYAPAPKSMRRRVSTAFRAWSRSTFSRESLVSSLKSLLWVAPLTVLIWIYAEREQVVTVPSVPVNIEAPAAEAGRVVTLVGLPNGTVHVELRGPQAGVDQVKDWIESATIPFDVDHNLTQGEHLIPLQPELNRLSRVVNSGVTIDKCEPDQVRVNIDPVTDMDAEVQARPEDLRRLAAPPVFTPSRVKVIGPRSVLSAAAAQGGTLAVYASFKPFAQQLSAPGKHDFSSVPLSINIDNPHVVLSPVTVSTTVVVKQPDQRYTLPLVRVLAASPSENSQTQRYRVDFDPPTLTGVTVVGPEEQIAKLQTKEFDVWAVFLPDYLNTAEAGTHTAPLTFHLPPGVELSPQDANRTITYSFKPRSAGE